MRKPNLVRRKRIRFHGPKILPWVHSPTLKGLVRCTTSRRKLMVTRAQIIRDAVENTQLGQNEKEVDSLKFFKGHNWVFA